MSLDILPKASILQHSIDDLANLQQRKLMSTDQLKRDLNNLAARELADLTVEEIAGIRAKQLALEPKPRSALQLDTRKVHAAIGIKNALDARAYLLGKSDGDSYLVEFIPNPPYSRETETYHKIQLNAFEQLLHNAFSKNIDFDEATNTYRPTDAQCDRAIVRSTITFDGEAEPNIVRFADSETNALFASEAGKYALKLVAEA